MSVSYFEKKSGISLVITIVLAVIIFVISFKFNSVLFFKFGEKALIAYEFFIFFFFQLFLLFYSIQGKGRRVRIIIWPLIVGIAYVVFEELYQVVMLKRLFDIFPLLVNISAILLSTLIYLLVVGHRKNVLWKGKDDGTHEKEVIELAEEKSKEAEGPKNKVTAKVAATKTNKKKVAPKVVIKSKKKASVKKAKSKTASAKSKKKTASKGSREESYFNLSNDNDTKKDRFAEKEPAEEVGDIIDDFDDEDNMGSVKRMSSEDIAVDFEKAEEERF
jgi:hypothetical protein